LFIFLQILHNSYRFLNPKPDQFAHVVEGDR
jgi:hypothetical protein